MATMVLSITQARPKLPELIKRVGAGEEIHMGVRHEDQATLIASTVLVDLKRLAQIAHRFMEVLAPEIVEKVVGDVQGQTVVDPWAGLKRSIRNGRVVTPVPSANGPARAFSRVPSDDEGRELAGTTWESMAARGNRNHQDTGGGGAAEPRRRFGLSVTRTTR